MTLKEIWNQLLEKKWTIEDVLYIALFIGIASILVTPLLGVPIGILFYFLVIDDSINSD